MAMAFGQEVQGPWHLLHQHKAGQGTSGRAGHPGHTPASPPPPLSALLLLPDAPRTRLASWGGRLACSLVPVVRQPHTCLMCQLHTIGDGGLAGEKGKKRPDSDRVALVCLMISDTDALISLAAPLWPNSRHSPGQAGHHLYIFIWRGLSSWWSTCQLLTMFL